MKQELRIEQEVEATTGEKKGMKGYILDVKGDRAKIKWPKGFCNTWIQIKFLKTN